MKKKVLVVDDTASILKMESTLLRLLGYEPIGAACGIDALKLLAQETPALALLDVMLPDMDGYKICHHIKNNPATADIPVVMVTAKISSEDIERGKKAGADDYICKPFKSSEMEALLTRFLKDG